MKIITFCRFNPNASTTKNAGFDLLSTHVHSDESWVQLLKYSKPERKGSRDWSGLARHSGSTEGTKRMLRTICTLQTVSYVTDSTVHTSQTVLYTSHRQCHSRVIDSTVNTSQAVPSTSHGQYHYGQYDIHVTGGIIHTS